MRRCLHQTLLCVLCACVRAAVSAYLVRMRVMNVFTKEEEWVTVAMIPQVEDKFETVSTEKASQLRKLLLQKTEYLVFCRLMQSSHHGVNMILKDGSFVIVSPLLLMYQCDYPEERSIMGLKHHGGDHDCTTCMAPSEDSCTPAGVGHALRPFFPTVDPQLKASNILLTLGRTRRVNDLENQFGIRACVPALAGWAGLGSGIRRLYQVPAFDQLYVRLSSVGTRCGQ